jgi:2-keto-4-pentenoate hydratase/2-oxohepta-3-ene-1,7-dioic acid hydratase in catechol pathway
MGRSWATVSSIWAAGSAIGIRPCEQRLPAVHLMEQPPRSAAQHRMSHCRRSRCCRRSPIRTRSSVPPPENPQVFLRLVNTLVAHNQPMVCPRISEDFDYEGELAVIIGKPGRHIAKSDALSHIFGYTCFNDGSVRDIQFKHSIAAGKNFHATGGFGPWIVTADEVPDPTRLHLVTRLNGKEVQHTGIDDLIFDIPTLVSYCSDWTPLVAGDVISTGTPEGVGFARKPPLWMKPGDVVEVEIDGGIGVLRNPIIAES